MEVLLAIITVMVLLFVGLVLSSNGECYYCGERFKESGEIRYRDGKKWCGCGEPREQEDCFE